MSKLWNKGFDLDDSIESFTVGDDYLLDARLVKYDCQATLAHAKMLLKICILTAEEFQSLEKAINEIKILEIRAEDEDGHTALENYLVDKCGDAGKKIHTARSRNDQVMVSMKLYAIDEIKFILKKTSDLMHALIEFAKQNEQVPIPGRTHTQLAMPSSLGLWAGAIAESLSDDSRLIEASLKIVDQCPLGSAASYGVSLPIDRQMVSDELSFSKVQNNVLYCANSRGKWESIVIASLAQLMLTLSKASNDLIFFSLSEMNYVSLPQNLCTGSSIMPHKRNPDALELIRAKTSTLNGYLMSTLEISRPLVSGYHRDFQETKRPLMHSLDIAKGAVAVLLKIIPNLEVHVDSCLNAFKPEVFATDWALDLVQAGVPFRQAYRQVALNPDKAPHQDPLKNILAKKHLGATGALGLDLINRKHS